MGAGPAALDDAVETGDAWRRLDREGTGRLVTNAIVQRMLSVEALQGRGGLLTVAEAAD